MIKEFLALSTVRNNTIKYPWTHRQYRTHFPTPPRCLLIAILSCLVNFVTGVKWTIKAIFSSFFQGDNPRIFGSKPALRLLKPIFPKTYRGGKLRIYKMTGSGSNMRVWSRRISSIGGYKNIERKLEDARSQLKDEERRLKAINWSTERETRIKKIHQRLEAAERHANGD